MGAGLPHAGEGRRPDKDVPPPATCTEAPTGRHCCHSAAAPCGATAYTARMPNPNARVRILPANEYRRVRWRNGLGWTREITRYPDVPQTDGDADDSWQWRLSIAEIEQDAAFSRFPGVDRELVLLHGEGLRLRFDDGPCIELLPPYASARFAGERGVTGELVDGRTTDFNLMWKRQFVDAALWRRPLVGTMVLFADPGETWAVHVLAGQARFVDGTAAALLEQGDTALVGAGDARVRSVLDGAGEALLMRLSRRHLVTGQ